MCQLARIVRHDVVGKERRPRLGKIVERVEERVAPARLHAAGGHPDRFLAGFRGIALVRDLLPQVPEHRLVERRAVALVEREHALLRPLLRHAAHPALVLKLRLVRAVEHHQQDVDAGGRRARHAVEQLAERTDRLVKPRRVEQHELPARILHDAPDRVARRLLHGTDNGHLLAHHPVHERGLAGVGAAHHAYDCRLARHLFDFIRHM